MPEIDELSSLQHRLENKRGTLLLIQERKSEYALSTDIPLDLIREERDVQQEIAALEAQVKTLAQAKPPVATAPMARPTARSASTSTGKARSSGRFLFGGLAVLIIAIIAVSVLPRLLDRSRGTAPQRVGVTATMASATSSPAATPPSSSEVAARNTPASGAAMPAFAVSMPTPTLTPPVAVNLTNNREGGYSNWRVLIDQADSLHLVYKTVLTRSQGDLFHHQLPKDGSWTPADILTTDMRGLTNYLELRQNAQGQLCVLWDGYDTTGATGNYMRCQTGPDWLATPMRQRPGPYLNAPKSALIRPDDAVDVVSSFNPEDTVVRFNDDVEIARDHLAQMRYPRLERDANGNYHAFWMRSGASYSLDYSRSTDGGKTWTETERLTGETDPPRPAGVPFAVVADGLGAVHLAWFGYGDFGDVNYRRWTADEGWSKAVKLAASIEPPDVAVDDQGLARVVWIASCQIWHVAQAADGSWPAPRLISDTKACSDEQPQIAIDATGRSHVVWFQDGDLYYTVVD